MPGKLPINLNALLRQRTDEEGRIPKMRAAMERNGSPEPRFATDEARTHFVVELPVHPGFAGLRVQDRVQDRVQVEAPVVAHDEAHDEAHDV